MEKQVMKFGYVRSHKIGEVIAKRGKSGGFMIGSIQWGDGFYSIAIFPDKRTPGKMNILVELPVYDTYSYKRDYLASRENAEANGAEEALDSAGDTAEAVDGIGNAPDAEEFEDLFKS